METLGQENGICNHIIRCQNDHGRLNMLENATNDIEDITREPDHDKDEREAIGRFTTEILEYLRSEDDDPACD